MIRKAIQKIRCKLGKHKVESILMVSERKEGTSLTLHDIVNSRSVTYISVEVCKCCGAYDNDLFFGEKRNFKVYSEEYITDNADSFHWDSHCYLKGSYSEEFKERFKKELSKHSHCIGGL